MSPDTPTALHAFDAVSLLIPLTMTGVEIAVALVNSSIKRLAPDSFLQVSPTLASRFGRIMPPWYVATFAVPALATWLHFRRSHALDLPLLIASALFASAILFSLAALVPLNNRIAGKSGSAADLLTVQNTWDRRHLLRILILLTADVLLLHALVR